MKPIFIGMAAGAALAILRQFGRNPLPLRRHPAQTGCPQEGERRPGIRISKHRAYRAPSASNSIVADEACAVLVAELQAIGNCSRSLQALSPGIQARQPYVECNSRL
jgi:hypothetical protein